MGVRPTNAKGRHEILQFIPGGKRFHGVVVWIQIPSQVEVYRRCPQVIGKSS